MSGSIVRPGLSSPSGSSGSSLTSAGFGWPNRASRRLGEREELRALRVVAGDQFAASALASARAGLQIVEIGAHAGHPRIERSAFGGRRRAEEEELSLFAADRMCVGDGAIDLRPLFLGGRLICALRELRGGSEISWRSRWQSALCDRAVSALTKQTATPSVASSAAGPDRYERRSRRPERRFCIVMTNS